MDWFEHNAWMVWLVLALVLGGIEMLSLSLVFVMLSGGALAALVTALLGGPAWLQGLVFAVVSVAMIAFVRPVAVKHMRPGIEDARTNVDRLIGTSATVVEPVDAARGLVKIGGDVWTARAERGEFLPGDLVKVVAIDGATAVVAPSGSTSPYRS
ncbi:membrane protein [Sinomonas cellulolyticus]|jgi:membrane protein implicated in regulation of membrane protease activity|uniref:NfeD family protein n=1 Tax=Sinomonas cellulolyticus TaxID=2801916 RepID=A0ABS1K2W8_9MICC|nr:MULTISPECIES: NfeD family protein [Sinomonas]MBL0705267.1 NfeD family protein [Sinomonas cellulolyticus]GHG40228.1 membrane protein [Sinomonas sp. KCTC 49339]